MWFAPTVSSLILTGFFRLTDGVFVEAGNGGVGATVRTRWPPQGIQTDENILMAAISSSGEAGAVRFPKPAW